MRRRLLIGLLLLACLWPAARAAAAGADNPADEPPFGGELPPPLIRPPSLDRPPPGFRLSAREAIRIARANEVIEAERAEDGPLSAVALERGERWQVEFFTGSGASRQEVAFAIVDDATGAVDEAWRNQQVSTPLARGYAGAIAQHVNAPYVWLPLCALFLAPFADPRRPFRLLHLDLVALLALSASLYFFNRADILASVPLTYPVLAYVFVRGLAYGLAPRDRAGPLVPLVPLRWLAVAAVILAAGRVALNVADSHVIDVGVAGVVGADRIEHGEPLYEGGFAPGVGIRGDVYGPADYLAYVPFEAILPWHGTWGSVPAAHAAAIAFDLATALGLLALGRRLRAGREGRALGVALAYAWLAYPFTLYTMNANANDSLVAALTVWALVAIGSAPLRGALVALAAAAKFGSAALAPLLAAGTGERRWRSALAFTVAFAAVAVAVVWPFVPDGGLREMYDRTLGYQASRGSPFSVWGLAPSLHFLQPLARGAAVALALALALWPRRRTLAQIAALVAAVTVAVQAGATHWFYFYVVWFLPPFLAAAFASGTATAPPGRPLPDRRPQLAELR